MTRILVIDNYDSFVYTIVGYLNQLGAETVVVRNDAVPPVAERTGFDGVLVSPGPGTPAEAGMSMQVIRDCAAAGTPMLGVCLGHQALGEVFGGVVTHAPELMHGKTSQIEHKGEGVLAGLPDPFTATRYHSLAVVNDTVSDELEVTAVVAATSAHHHGPAAPHAPALRGPVPPRVGAHRGRAPPPGQLARDLRRRRRRRALGGAAPARPAVGTTDEGAVPQDGPFVVSARASACRR